MSGPYDPYFTQHQQQPPPQLHREPSSGRSATPVPKKAAQKPKRPSFSDQIDVQGDGSGPKLRAYAACKNCRVKKIKCLPGPHQPSSAVPGAANFPSSQDQEPNQLGPCQQCLQAGVECTYAPTRDRAAYSRQYVATLETRVQALETFQARMLPLLRAYEGQHGQFVLPGVSGDRREGKDGVMETKRTAARKDDGIITGQAQNIPLESSEFGEGEDDQAMQVSDAEDVGQMTQDERGNYRWIGSSNTLSLLDSFSHRDDDHHAEHRLLPLSANLQRVHSQTLDSHPTSSGHSPNTAAGSDHTPRNPYFGEVAGAGVVKALPAVEEVQHPAKDKAEEMIDAFFREVHPSLPVVLEYEFREQYTALNAARDRSEPWPGGGFIAVVFAIFALGERVLVTSQAWQRERAKLEEKNRQDSETVLPGEAEAGVVWYERAQILHYTTSTDINIHQVQALTLMAAFQASVNAVPMSWLQAGKALRVAQDLGLHRSTARLNITFAEKQLRARCWWAIYGLERLMSISLGRPLGVDDLDIDVAYPAEIDDEGLRLSAHKDPKATPGGGQEPKEEPVASTMSGFVALTKLCKIAGKVAHLLYRPSNGRSVNDPSWALSQQNAINKLDKHLRDWLEHEVPSKYKDPSATHSVALFSAILSNSYFAVLITLHRNFLPSNPDYPRPKPPPSSQSLAHCVDAARSVVHIGAQSRILIPPSHHLAMYCQYLWSSAIILLLCEVQARDQVVIETVGAQVESCRRCLQALEPVWPGSKKLKELLNDVAARAKDVQVADTANAARPGKKRKSLSMQIQQQEQTAQPLHESPRRRSGTSPQGGPGSWQMTPSHSAGQSDVNKRQRLFETSDTRTVVREDDSQQPNQQPPAQYSTQTFYPPNIPTYPPITAAPYQADQFVPSFDMSFDLGGVTFDGLDMLQGFGDSASNFWNSLGFIGDPGPGSSGTGSGANSFNANVNPDPFVTSSNNNAITSTQTQMFSGQNTPTSAGPSPTWHLSAPTHNQQLPQQQALAPQQSHQSQQYAIIPSAGRANQTSTHGGQIQNLGRAPGEINNPLAEFWDQIAGNSFDWQADPNVPFNI